MALFKGTLLVTIIEWNSVNNFKHKYCLKYVFGSCVDGFCCHLIVMTSMTLRMLNYRVKNIIGSWCMWIMHVYNCLVGLIIVNDIVTIVFK